MDIEHLRLWIGRERLSPDELHPYPARALAAALDHTSLPSTGDELALGWHWLYFLDTPSSANTSPDGHARSGDFLPPTGLPRRMWAGGSMHVARGLRIGSPARRHSVVTAVDVKNGTSGPLVFVTLEHILSQDDVTCIREVQRLVYREMPAAPAPLPDGQNAPADADWVSTLQPDPVLLFRYSALTYNAHRIHYDRSYATEKEFYPALVVHAPLQVTLLLDQVRAELPGARITDFSFRAQRPCFDSCPLTLSGKRSGQRLELWTADHHGYVCMSATATLA